MAKELAHIDRIDVRVCRIATEGGPETDGTATWDATTIVIVEARGGGLTGIGYSYIDAAAAAVVRDLLAPAVIGVPLHATPAAMNRMLRAIRNHGRPGLVACAISAVDLALWDLKARVLAVPVASLLGPARRRVPVYASGGFTSESLEELDRELSEYAEQEHVRVKIKIGRDAAHDLERVRVARDALGPDIELMVDANGAYARKQALAMADRFEQYDVVYFEEPVSSDDLEGLRLMRDRAPAGMAIAAGEYGYDGWYFQRMLDAQAVDILQADATRCLGATGFMQANALCAARSLPLSSHCAPSLHAHLDTAASQIVHLEYFRDHARVEHMLFDGVPEVVAGAIAVDPVKPGFGLTLRETEVARHAA
ncbi:MAG TPA: enolase C-terminal domain-like protein [Kofleriaceae bacterium]|nr:enolase C-terminal domain-like protein [Kofleriaceae bacterium]